MSGQPDLPDGLSLVMALVRTKPLPGGDDPLGTVAGCRAWLASSGYDGTEVGEAELARLGEVRDAVWLTLLAHGENGDPGAAVRALAPICESSSLTLTVVADGEIQVAGSGAGVDGLVNDVLAAMAVAAIDGSWQRLKVCHEPTCRSAFWDRTKNRSQRFCTPSRCGNRARQREFRARQVAHNPT